MSTLHFDRIQARCGAQKLAEGGFVAHVNILILSDDVFSKPLTGERVYPSEEEAEAAAELLARDWVEKNGG